MAEQKYNIAIECARSSKFIHEEALACELAAKHYERNCDPDMAISLFRQAKKCYREWGSKKKVQHVAEAIERITQGKHP
eukprot:scaffold41388_cov125-Cyclotella_meneghiniana.AAC.5